MDDAVRDYIEAIAPERRPLFDRVHRLVFEVHPDAEVLLSYQMPTYSVDDYRLYVGVWKHGLSFYGWEPGRDGGFSSRYPELITKKGTIKLGPAAAANIPDPHLRDLIHGALGG